MNNINLQQEISLVFDLAIYFSTWHSIIHPFTTIPIRGYEKEKKNVSNILISVTRL